MRAVVVDSEKELAARVKVADSFFSRLRGLLGASSLPQGEGLWIVPCKGVHTFGMRFPIDVLFLDKDNRVVQSIVNIRPNRYTPIFRAAVSALELPAFTVDHQCIAIGDKIEFE